MKDEKPGVYPFTRGIYNNMYKDTNNYKPLQSKFMIGEYNKKSPD